MSILFGQNRSKQADDAFVAFLDPATATNDEMRRALRAMGLVMADLAEIALGVSQATARQEVRDRWKAYYKAQL